jgi:hypothetical protein
MRTREEIEGQWQAELVRTYSIEGMQAQHLKHIFGVLLDIRDLLIEANKPNGAGGTFTGVPGVTYTGDTFSSGTPGINTNK